MSEENTTVAIEHKELLKLKEFENAFIKGECVLMGTDFKTGYTSVRFVSEKQVIKEMSIEIKKLKRQIKNKNEELNDSMNHRWKFW